MIALPLVPLLIYRLSSLENASYTLERESIRLRWGWRIEMIPMPHVQWVRTAADLGRSLPRPHLRWPGAIYGTRRYPGGRMDIEYMASTTKGLLVIATTERLYAISPANPDNLLMTYQHFTEMGSLLAPPASSVYPTNLIARLITDSIGIIFRWVFPCLEKSKRSRTICRHRRASRIMTRMSSLASDFSGNSSSRSSEKESMPA